MPFDEIHELLPTPPHRQPDWVGWHALSPWCRTLIKQPAFMLGDCPAALAAYYHDQTMQADTGVYRLRDTGVTGSGMIVHGPELVACNQLGHSADWCRREVSSERIREPKTYRRRTVQSAVLLLGGGYDVYGHWLVDILPKLFALHLIGLDVSTQQFLVPSDTHQFGLNWLSLVGIREDQIIRYDPGAEIVFADELIVPALLRSGSRGSILFRDAVDFIVDRLSRHNPELAAAPPTPDAIFISRAQANRDGRSMRNRQEIEALAVDHGYTLVSPERLPIIEQVALFRGARRIVGEYGSGLHGSIFSQPRARVCSLRGGARHPGFLQSGLAQSLDQECGYVLGRAPLDAIEFQFDIDPDHLRQAMHLMMLPDGC